MRVYFPYPGIIKNNTNIALKMRIPTDINTITNKNNKDVFQKNKLK